MTTKEGKRLNLLQRVRRKYNAIRVESKAWRGHYKGITAWSQRPQQIHAMWLRDGVPEYRKEMKILIEKHLEENPDWIILDCGCGTGLTYWLLDEKYKERYYGLDFTPEMISFCKKEYPEAKRRFQHVNVLGLSDILHDDTFNMCITQNVLQHIAPYTEALDQILRVTDDLVIFCERTEKYKETVMKSLTPYVRWNFNRDRFYELLEVYGNFYNFQKPEIISSPLSTEKLIDVLTIYRMKKL